jgi:lipopolysaccharide export system permease protein
MPTNSKDHAIWRRSWLRHLRPLRLDFYILSEILVPFLGGVLFFSFIFLMSQALRLADFFIIHGISVRILGKMALLLVLSIMPMALPVAFLIGILVGFGRLSADSELTAMKSNGVSIFRLSVPVTVLGLVIVFISLGLNMEWVPWGDRMFKSTLIRLSNTQPVSSIKAGTFTSGFFDLLIFADKIEKQTNKLYRVFIYDEREPKNPLTVVAREGTILPVRKRASKGSEDFGAAVMLKLYQGNIHRNDIPANTYQKIDFGEYRLYLKIDEGADTATIKPRMIPYEELVRRIKNTPKRSQEHIEFVTELWRRFSVALTPLIFVYLGIGFGTVRTRAVRAGAALIALTVILIYWAALATATVASHKGFLPPTLAMQIPNVFMLAIGIKGFRTAAW